MYMKKVIAAAFIATMVAVAGMAQFKNNSRLAGPTGSWEGVVTNLQGGPPPFRMLMTFNSDGGWIGSSDGDATSGASASHGVWQQIGDGSSRTYAVTFRQIQDDQNSAPTASVTVRQKFTMNSAGDAIEGPFEVKIFLPDGTLVFTGGGVATAARIQSDPLL